MVIIADVGESEDDDYMRYLQTKAGNDYKSITSHWFMTTVIHHRMGASGAI